MELTFDIKRNTDDSKPILSESESHPRISIQRLANSIGQTNPTASVSVHVHFPNAVILSHGLAQFVLYFDDPGPLWTAGEKNDKKKYIIALVK